MKAILRSYRQAPRKVRLVANLIKGKTVPRALVELDVLPKRASGPMKKLLMSAIANAKENNGIALADLFIKEVRVDQGTILKRSMPKSHGSAHPIHKHTSHIMIELIASAGADAQVKSVYDQATKLADWKSKVDTDADKPKVSKKTALAKVKASAKPKPKSKATSKGKSLVAKN